MFTIETMQDALYQAANRDLERAFRELDNHELRWRDTCTEAVLDYGEDAVRRVCEDHGWPCKFDSRKRHTAHF